MNPTTCGACKFGNFSRCIVLPSILDSMGDEKDDDRMEAFEQLHAKGEETGYEAPELVGDGDEIPGQESNLWSTSTVIIAIMTGRTVQDLILELEFFGHAQRKTSRGQLLETWNEAPLVQCHALPLRLAGSSGIAEASPEQYPLKLRVLVEALLVFDPLDRGDAVDVLRDVEAKFEKRMLKV